MRSVPGVVALARRLDLGKAGPVPPAELWSESQLVRGILHRVGRDDASSILKAVEQDCVRFLEPARSFSVKEASLTCPSVLKLVPAILREIGEPALPALLEELDRDGLSSFVAYCRLFAVELREAHHHLTAAIPHLEKVLATQYKLLRWLALDTTTSIS